MSEQYSEKEFNQILARLAEGLGLASNRITQVQMAEKLEIRQSSISDAKRRGSIPAEWFLKALEIGGVDPEWVRTGKGPKYRLLANTPDGALSTSELRKEIVKENKRELSTNELINILKSHFPSGATVAVNYSLECTGSEEETSK